MYQDLLAKLARALDAAEIPYMVIGGQAVLFHGEPRLTRDIDITLGVEAIELPRVRTHAHRFVRVKHAESWLRLLREASTS